MYLVEHFLGLSGRISGSYDVDYVSITNAVNEIFRTNDLVNANTGKIDPRHMYGMTNHDIFRWPAVQDGRIKSYLGVAMLNLLLPGIPLLYYGEEQDMILLDNTASNYICKRVMLCEMSTNMLSWTSANVQLCSVADSWMLCCR